MRNSLDVSIGVLCWYSVYCAGTPTSISLLVPECANSSHQKPSEQTKLCVIMVAETGSCDMGGRVKIQLYDIRAMDTREAALSNTFLL